MTIEYNPNITTLKEKISCPYCGAVFEVEKPKEEEEEQEIATENQKKELEIHINKINLLKKEVLKNIYYIGKELNEINNKGLWKGLGFKTFFEFAKSKKLSHVMFFY